jgi:hypothetical protein
MAIRKYNKEKDNYWCNECGAEIKDIKAPTCEKCKSNLYWDYEIKNMQLNAQRNIQNLQKQSNFWFIVLAIGVIITIFGLICS